ncbi:S-(hydroxymethyl)glutathione dehydrogenase / alcohol dehydrogenase [Alteribacillus bidgolensis]|uniref:S-(Hydroxymethyl)glutathione dehydrogenase / alcohol dehydrogenase n=1 Tax=Alteribacillus bidgolensis TaxID=930129 RepID=A0A1G8ICW8_9BACI|nr:S-(hydroxymethyl)glutathione dehydrogenase / alcohol dehydrogenase [Alteribacillus bidgolensis]
MHENTKGGADVVIDCVGMDGTVPPSKKHGSEGDNQFGTISPIVTASQAVGKFGTVQLTGVYGTEANNFPLGDFLYKKCFFKNGASPCHSLDEIV